MLASAIATLVHWCEPWQTLYSNSKVLETTVTGTHIVATLVGGGIAIAADRTTLRALRSGAPLGPEALRELRSTHRPVLIGLVVLFVSGVALAAADVETFAQSPAFLLKLALVLLLCVNGVFLARAEHRLRPLPSGPGPAGAAERLRLTSWLSIGLWISTTIVGTALLNA